MRCSILGKRLAIIQVTRVYQGAMYDSPHRHLWHVGCRCTDIQHMLACAYGKVIKALPVFNCFIKMIFCRSVSLISLMTVLAFADSLYAVVSVE